MTTPKRHHYVPRMLLKNFTDAGGWLHWAEVGGSPPALHRARPSELFHKNHLYSTLTEDGTKDVSIELGLAKLEDDTAPVVERMIAAARDDRVPELSDAERRLWYSFFATQWRRTPETRASVASETTVATMFDDIIADTKRLLPDRVAEIDALATSDMRTRSVRNAWATTLPQAGGTEEAVLATRGILILRIRRPNKAFVIGSRPVVKITPAGHGDLRDPACELWLPVASDLAIGAGLGTGGIDLLYLDRPDPVRLLSTSVASQSRVVAAHSPKLVRSIASAR